MHREKEEKERLGEAYEPEEKVWNEIELKPFEMKEEKLVICLDTLG